MFHYRPTISGRQLRVLVAALGAIAAHIALIGLTVDHKPHFTPQLSLPRSVNVFLGQNSSQPAENTDAKELQEKSIEQIPPVTDKLERIHPAIPVKKKPEKTFPAPVPDELTVKPVEKRPVEAKQVFRQSSKSPKTDAENPANIQTLRSGADIVDKPAGEGVKLPGTEQLAYPRYQLNSPPVYPGLARKRGQQGTVVLQVLVDSKGRVEDIKVDLSSNYPMLDHAAMKAVKKWLFEPGRKDDKKVVMWVKVPVTFKLNDN